MSAKLAVAVAVLFASISSLAQVQPAAGKRGVAIPVNFSAGGGMDYFWGDGWGVKRWGPLRLGLPQLFGITWGSMWRATP